MADYHALYLKLFGVQADAISALQATTQQLIQAHLEAEEAVMSAPEPQIIPLDPDRKDTE